MQGSDFGRLADELERLLASEPVKKEQLERWHNDAANVVAFIQTNESLKEVPHFLWHYFSDADIRLEGGEYATIQRERLQLVIKRLRMGSMPTDSDTEL
jgi:hypothetical protein